jgi:hypothetical protein
MQNLVKENEKSMNYFDGMKRRRERIKEIQTKRAEAKRELAARM